MKPDVVIGLSGGVDSAVAAYLLKKQGYSVAGVNMILWESGGNEGKLAEEAQTAARQLDIPLYTVERKELFKQRVIDYFINEYINGRTPNPCTVCNPGIKWDILLEQAEELGAESVATGHYARLVNTGGRYSLAVSNDTSKDQTYALYRLSQAQLKKTIFPLEDYEKKTVRDIAVKAGLSAANKPDSQEICFVSSDGYGQFIQGALEQASTKSLCQGFIPGDFVDERGFVLGRHQGIARYTVGQRKGLGLAFGKPVYVKYIDACKNQVVLADNDALFEHRVRVSDINYMAVSEWHGSLRAQGKLRYAHRPSDCTVTWEDGGLLCIFDEPQRAVTPGQAAVFYADGRVLFGGVIQSAQ